MIAKTLLHAVALTALSALLGEQAMAHPLGMGHRHVYAPKPVAVAPYRANPTSTFRGARGGSQFCDFGTCSRNTSVTGPNGNTASRSGNASCADGTCTASRSVTGPGGESRSFERTISR